MDSIYDAITITLKECDAARIRGYGVASSVQWNETG